VVTGKEHKVLKLRKALYGLHQAPRAWIEKSLGFRKSSSELAIYLRRNIKSQLVVGVYVDDLIITGTNCEDINLFKKEMAAVFKMTDLGLLKYYLGIEVRQNKEGISLIQGAYAAQILERNGMKECNPCQTPIETRLKLSKLSTEPLVDATIYRSVVGSLRYLVNTRPDLAFAVGYVNQFLEEPHKDHMMAVKHILRYVKGTKNWGLRFCRKRRKEVGLIGYSDSDYAGMMMAGRTRLE
jgi:hypothetical protein